MMKLVEFVNISSFNHSFCIFIQGLHLHALQKEIQQVMYGLENGINV